MTLTCKQLPGAPPFRPLANQVLVEKMAPPERFQEMSDSGLIWLPADPARQANNYSHRGRVVVVGPGDKWRWRHRTAKSTEDLVFFGHPKGRYPMDLEPGDLVVYERRPWAEFQWEGKDYVCLVETQHILAYSRSQA